MTLNTKRLLRAAKDGQTANGFEVIDINFASEIVVGMHYSYKCDYLLDNNLTWDDVALCNIYEVFESSDSYYEQQNINYIASVIAFECLHWSAEDSFDVVCVENPFYSYELLDIRKFSFHFFIKRPGISAAPTGLFAGVVINEELQTLHSLKGNTLTHINTANISNMTTLDEDISVHLQSFIDMFFEDCKAEECDVWVLIQNINQ